MDYREKVLVFGEEKIKEVGKLIKSKVEKLPLKTSWPPNSNDLQQEKVQILHLLELFCTILLTNETVPSERDKRLGYDIIYNTTRRKRKTAKSTQLRVFVKRKAESRLLIECLSRLHS